MAYVDAAHAAEGTALAIDLKGTPSCRPTVTKLPFYKRAEKAAGIARHLTGGYDGRHDDAAAIRTVGHAGREGGLDPRGRVSFGDHPGRRRRAATGHRTTSLNGTT